jgi:hypothetical protein
MESGSYAFRNVLRCSGVGYTVFSWSMSATANIDRRPANKTPANTPIATFVRLDTAVSFLMQLLWRAASVAQLGCARWQNWSGPLPLLRFVRYQPLQLGHLQPEFMLLAVLRWHFAMVQHEKDANPSL